MPLSTQDLKDIIINDATRLGNDPAVMLALAAGLVRDGVAGNPDGHSKLTQGKNWTDLNWAWSKKALANYLVTGPHSNAIGAYLLPDAYIADDLGWTAETVTQTLSKPRT